MYSRQSDGAVPLLPDRLVDAGELRAASTENAEQNGSIHTLKAVCLRMVHHDQ